MIYTAKQLLHKYENYVTLARLVKSGKLFKVSYGVYSDCDNSDAELETIFLTYENITLTNESAFLYYDLSEYIPEKYTIVSDIKGTIISSDNVRQSFMSKDYLYIGRKRIKTKHGSFYIYDIERMLIEIIRLRKKFNYEYFKEIITSYRRKVINGELNIGKVFEYCKKFKNGDHIREEIEDLVL